MSVAMKLGKLIDHIVNEKYFFKLFWGISTAFKIIALQK